jgi:HMG (high mobility group) box
VKLHKEKYPDYSFPRKPSQKHRKKRVYIFKKKACEPNETSIAFPTVESPVNPVAEDSDDLFVEVPNDSDDLLVEVPNNSDDLLVEVPNDSDDLLVEVSNNSDDLLVEVPNDSDDLLVEISNDSDGESNVVNFIEQNDEPDKNVNGKGKKDVHIKKPMNAFFIWCIDERQKIFAEYPDMPPTDVTKTLGKILYFYSFKILTKYFNNHDLGVRWRAMTDLQKQPYIAEQKR